MYNEEGMIKPEFKSLEKDWTMKVGADENNKFTEFRDKIIEINKINHGNYDPNSALLVKKDLLGRMFTQFRTWMFEGFNTRMAGKIYNKQLGRWTEGRYKAYVKTGFKGSAKFALKSLLEMLTFGYGISKDKLRGDIKDDLTYVNMRKNMSELKMYGTLGMLTFLLKGLAAEEDDEALEKTYRVFANTFFRMQQDAEFYVNPRTAQDILRNPAPVVKTIDDIAKAIEASQSYLYDPEAYEDSRKDPLIRKWGKVIPFGNSIVTADYIATTELE